MIKNSTFTPLMPAPLIPCRRSWLSMQSSMWIACHRCGHEWLYMGSKVELIQREKPKKPVRIWCLRCRAMIRLDTLFAAAQEEQSWSITQSKSIFRFSCS